MPQRAAPGTAQEAARSAGPCPAARRSTQPGLTLAELLTRTGAELEPLRTALRHECERGRVTLDGSGYRLVPSAFDPGTLAALRAL